MAIFEVVVKQSFQFLYFFILAEIDLTLYITCGANLAHNLQQYTSISTHHS